MAQAKTSKHLLTTILTSLNSISPPHTATSAPTSGPHDTILKHLTAPDQQQVKNVLLTLHFLFPHELLPALDLIDRRLITHLYTIPSQVPINAQPPLTSSSPVPPPATTNPTKTHSSNPQVYYVQSASSNPTNTTNPSKASISTSTSRPSRFRNALSKPNTFYEVHLTSWNCSCPAFAYSAIKLLMRDPETANDINRHVTAGEKPDWLMGGTATKDHAVMPVCKHILAVALAKAAPALFGHGVEEREVGREEMAGWAAGWGDH